MDDDSNWSSKKLVAYVLLLGLALQQLPNFLEVLDLHYHSFPMLVVLGVLHSVLRRSDKKNDSASECPANLSSVQTATSLSASLASMEEYYLQQNQELCEHLQQQEEEDGTPLAAANVKTEYHHSVDEWGHFADFEESPPQDLANFAVGSSSSSVQLTVLEEIDEEE
jgi:hypothetical protein